MFAQAVLIAAILYGVLEGWHRDFRVPLWFYGDSLVLEMQSKSTIDNGWWWSNPMLSAPFTFDALAFPANSNVDQAIVSIAGRLVAYPLAAVNVAWMIMVVFSGLTATWCMRRVGVSGPSAMVAGTLFAVSPYALYRNIDHFNLVIYLVPFPCAVALQLAAGQSPGRWYWKGWGGLLAGCVLLGFNYAYYPFFGCFFIGVAAVTGFVLRGSTRVLAAGAVWILLLTTCTGLNLLPSVYSWSRHGEPVIVAQKGRSESEVFGLKIRHLVSPVLNHVFPPLARLAELEAAVKYPLENENATSRLGLVGTLGFLGLLGVVFVPSLAGRLERGDTLLAASQLTIAAVLLATIGGFGTLFNALISPEIRAYNRVCPFIEFFSLTAVALALDALCARSGRGRAAALIAVLVLGVLDQSQAAEPMNARHASVAADIPPLRTFVGQLEDVLPDRAMVFQLPFKVYLNDAGSLGMGPYDHLRLYLVSRRIHWSYPALSNEQVRWQQTLQALDGAGLLHRLAADGFAALVVDRYGYSDNGDSMTATIGAILGDHSVIAESDRYVAFDVRSLASAGPRRSG